MTDSASGFEQAAEEALKIVEQAKVLCELAEECNDIDEEAYDAVLACIEGLLNGIKIANVNIERILEISKERSRLIKFML